MLHFVTKNITQIVTKSGIPDTFCNIFCNKNVIFPAKKCNAFAQEHFITLCNNLVNGAAIYQNVTKCNISALNIPRAVMQRTDHL